MRGAWLGWRGASPNTLLRNLRAARSRSEREIARTTGERTRMNPHQYHPIVVGSGADGAAAATSVREHVLVFRDHRTSIAVVPGEPPGAVGPGAGGT